MRRAGRRSGSLLAGLVRARPISTLVIGTNPTRKSRRHRRGPQPIAVSQELDSCPRVVGLTAPATATLTTVNNFDLRGVYGARNDHPPNGVLQHQGSRLHPATAANRRFIRRELRRTSKQTPATMCRQPGPGGVTWTAPRATSSTGACCSGSVVSSSRCRMHASGGGRPGYPWRAGPGEPAELNVSIIGRAASSTLCSATASGSPYPPCGDFGCRRPLLCAGGAGPATLAPTSPSVVETRRQPIAGATWGCARGPTSDAPPPRPTAASACRWLRRRG